MLRHLAVHGALVQVLLLPGFTVHRAWAGLQQNHWSREIRYNFEGGKLWVVLASIWLVVFSFFNVNTRLVFFSNT